MSTVLDNRFYREAPKRTLAHVLCDIAEAQRAFNASWGHPNELDNLDHLDALSDEAREMIEQATGVSWFEIARACL